MAKGFYDSNELMQIFKGNKRLFDNAYEVTKERYDEKQANIAMYEYFVNYETKHITRSAGARDVMNKFQYHGAELDQFLMEYAMSSYIANNMECPFTLDEIRAYSNSKNKGLKYDRDSIIALVALGSAWNSYWFTNVLACNHRVKAVLVESLIKERYIANKKDFLDNAKKIKIVKLKDDKQITISINKLNRDIDNIIRDDEGTYFIDDDYEREYRGKGR